MQKQLSHLLGITHLTLVNELIRNIASVFVRKLDLNTQMFAAVRSTVALGLTAFHNGLRRRAAVLQMTDLAFHSDGVQEADVVLRVLVRDVKRRQEEKEKEEEVWCGVQRF